MVALRSWLLLSLLAALSTSIVAGCASSTESFLPGLSRPEHEPSSADPIDEAGEMERLRVAASSWYGHVITIHAGEIVERRTRRELGLQLLNENDPEGDYEVDHRRIEVLGAELAQLVQREPRAGSVDFEASEVVPHRVGHRLSATTARDFLINRLAAGETEITVPVIEVLPSEGIAPEGLELTTVIGEWTTRFRRHGRYRNRGRNVAKAAENLDGAILMPRGTLSFNQRVGPREWRTGFREAPVLVRGELVDGMGGGICQVSSTLHAAAWFGGLEMVEHRVHSRPSAYIETGLDATVSWPDLDLVIANPFDFPVAVHAFTDGTRLTVQILGAAKLRSVEWTKSQHTWEYYDTREISDSSIPLGSEVQSQRGIRGRTVSRVRRITEGDRVWVEEDQVVYPPSPRIIRVGTGQVMAESDFDAPM